MKKALAITLVVFTFTLSTIAQEICTRHTEVSGGFSLCLPTGWTAVEEKGEKFKVLESPSSGGLGANIIFLEESSAAPLNEYVDSSVKNFLGNFEKLGFTKATLVSRSDFVTDSKERGVKLVFSSELKGFVVASFQYIFDSGSKKLIVTASVLESRREASEKVFDSAVRTLQMAGKIGSR